MTRKHHAGSAGALAGTLAAMVASRLAADGVRAVRILLVRAGAGLARRAWDNAADSRRRAHDAVRAYRGEAYLMRHRPAAYATTAAVAGVVAGAAGTVTLLVRRQATPSVAGTESSTGGDR